MIHKKLVYLYRCLCTTYGAILKGFGGGRRELSPSFLYSKRGNNNQAS